jgi:hypothetical protein
VTVPVRAALCRICEYSQRRSRFAYGRLECREPQTPSDAGARVPRKRYRQGEALDEPPNHVKRSACQCGPSPEQCVSDSEVLAQHGWVGRSFRNQPRIDRERGLSVLRGEVSLEGATRYVLPREPNEQDLRKACIRRTTAAALRRAGFAVVHTPGKVRGSVHCTVAWPGADPLENPQVPWPPEVSAAFDSCFNEVWEVNPDES